MSRTIRRKNVRSTGRYYGDERSYTHEDDTEHAWLHGGWKRGYRYDWETRTRTFSYWYFDDVAWGGRKSVPKKGKEYKKGWWRYHGDTMRFWSNGKGTGWWRREFIQRPHRRDAKRQIQRSLVDDDFEYIIRSKPKRPWWD